MGGMGLLALFAFGPEIELLESTPCQPALHVLRPLQVFQKKKTPEKDSERLRSIVSSRCVVGVCSDGSR